MLEFIDILELYVGLVNNIAKGVINFDSPLQEMVIKTSGNNLAYIDNRKDTLEKYKYDFWKEFKNHFSSDTEFEKWIKDKGIEKRLLCSKSEQFPDFMFKVKRSENRLISGSLLELKDSKSGTIASFNSTLPTKRKSLKEIAIINSGKLVQKIASVKDGNLSDKKGYYDYQRKCFYLVRTYKNRDKVKISVVDGAFFETIPKENLIYKMFMNILKEHLEKKEVDISLEKFKEITRIFSHITDQTIIAKSQNINSASVRPRLRIMAEVHSQGNPHNSSFYPKIVEQSLNLILKISDQERENVEKIILKKVPEIKIFVINHKRNGEHVVLQYQL